MDLETISRRHGTDAGNLVQELKAVNRETYDYADFLRRYASLGEVTQVNQDEFDYIYYTSVSYTHLSGQISVKLLTDQTRRRGGCYRLFLYYLNNTITQSRNLSIGNL